MRSLHFLYVCLLSFLLLSLIIDSLTLRAPAWMRNFGYDPDTPIWVTLLWGLASAVACTLAHLVSASNSTESTALMLLLVAAHAFCFVSDALDRPTRMEWASEHVVATLLALLGAFMLKLARVLLKMRRWHTLLHRAEAQQLVAERDPHGPILLLFANVGSGHKRAAEAIRAALLARGAPADEVKLIDAMELVPHGFRYVMQTMFQELTQSLAGQHVLGYLYDAADRGRAKARLQRRFENLCMLSLIEEVAEKNPSAIVCTHFLPAQLFSGLQKHSSVLKRLPISVVLTDLDLQFMWLHPVTQYFMPRPEAATLLRGYAAAGADIGEAGVTVSGIPILPTFAAAAAEAAEPPKRAAASRAVALRKFGLAPPTKDNRPVVVLMSSGKLFVETYRELLSCATPLRLVLVMGRQADMRRELEGVALPPRHAVYIHGFVSEMAALLRSADLLISKSGGLTIAEAAAIGVPMVVLDPIPGQEQRNADVLLEAGAAVKINDLPLLPSKVDEIVSGGRLGAMSAAIRKLGPCLPCTFPVPSLYLPGRSAAIRKLGRPDAAFVVADAVLRQRAERIRQPVGAQGANVRPSAASPSRRSSLSPLRPRIRFAASPTDRLLRRRARSPGALEPAPAAER